MTQTSVNQLGVEDLFVNAQAFIERGDLAQAETLLLAIINEGSQEISSGRIIQARTALAEIYEGMGRYTDAGEVLAPYDPHELDHLAPHLRGLLLLAFGSRAYWQNDFPRSITLLNRAREILEPLGDPANIARAFHCLGRSYWALDEQALAREHYEIAIEWGRRARKDRALAITYMNLGLVARHEGDMDEAGMCYRRALRLLRHTADEISRARLQNNLGVMLLYQGNFYEAVNSSRRALEHLSGHHDDLLIGIVNNNLAVTCIHTGEWAQAESHVQQALSIARARADRLSEGVYTETLGSLRGYQGRMEEANELLRFALERAREMGSRKDEMLAFLSLSRLWLSARNMHLALTYARNARDLAREVGDERIACESALLMAEGYRRSDKWMPAEDWAMMAKAELERLPYPYLDAILQRNIACFVSRRRDSAQGERIFRQAEESFRSMNASYQVAATIFEHGESLVRRGEHATAFERFTEAARQFQELGARLDAERAEREAQRTNERMSAWQVAPSPSINLIPPDAAPLVMQVLNAASGRERLLRELMFAAKYALSAEGAIIFAADDDAQLYAQASIDLDEREREGAAKAVSEHLESKEQKAGGEQSESTALGLQSQTISSRSGHCRTLSSRRNGGAFVLYLKVSGPISGKRAEILDALVGCARLALQMIDMRADARRARPFNAVNMPRAQGLFPKLISTSIAMRDVLARMERLKDSDATVLVLGESGTGKEVIARALHEESQRRDKVFLPFNCSAAPRELVESQLFGHKRGTFTGAINDQRGIIRAAEGGTLFLDEIGDLSPEVQPKLLRFLQNGEIMPLGEAPRKVNVRVIAATNRDLEQDVREGHFREDLFYRLNTFVIKLPRLAERPEDIPLLAIHFFDEMCRKHNRQLAGITPEAMDYLTRYSWPGNVRQLRSEIERIVVFAEDGQAVGAESLSSDILRAASVSSPVRFQLDFSRPVNYKELMIDIERQLLSEALARHGGNVTRTAELLNMRRQTLDYKLRKFRLGNPNINLVGEDEDFNPE
jgi:hydrogenase-4 transcriptional activator